MKRFITSLLIIVMVFVFAACGSIDTSAYDPDDTELRTIEIAMGSTATSIGEQLVNEGIISDSKGFKDYMKDNGYDSRLQAGVYSLSPAMDFETIAEILVGGKVATVDFTLPEGLTIEQTAAKLAKQDLGSEDAFLKVMKEGDFSEFEFIDPSLGENQLEGYLLPSTYTVYPGLSEDEIVRYLLEQFQKKVYSLYNESNNDHSLNEIMTTASIIERECKVAEERPLVSSVIYNRISTGMKLEMCSTIQYLLLKETGEVKENLLYSDLEIESPYNTYKNPGLPPGPICSPGMASIEAAMNPADTDYLYFVLSAALDGTSKFSSSWTQFEQDKAAYSNALKNQ